MSIGIKIALSGVIGLIAFSLLFSFSIDNVTKFLDDNNLALDQIPILKTWSGRFLIIGLGSLIALFAIIAPIGEIKLFVLFGDFLGGAIAWLLV